MLSDKMMLHIFFFFCYLTRQKKTKEKGTEVMSGRFRLLHVDEQAKTLFLVLLILNIVVSMYIYLGKLNGKRFQLCKLYR